MAIVNFRNTDGLSDRQRELADLVNMSEQILSFAELGDWNSAVKLQQHRRQSMDAFFADACPPAESAEVASAIEHILSVDKNVSEILYNYRSKLLLESGTESRNMRRLDNYLSNSL